MFVLFGRLDSQIIPNSKETTNWEEIYNDFFQHAYKEAPIIGPVVRFFLIKYFFFF